MIKTSKEAEDLSSTMLWKCTNRIIKLILKQVKRESKAGKTYIVVSGVTSRGAEVNFRKLLSNWGEDDYPKLERSVIHNLQDRGFDITVLYADGGLLINWDSSYKYYVNYNGNCVKES